MLTIAITAATPMMMPSMVRAARILLRTRARKATRMIFKKSIVVLSAVARFAGSAPFSFVILGLAPQALCSHLLRRLFIVVVFDYRQILQFFRGVAWVFNLLVRLDLAILKNHDSRGILRDVRFVRDQHECDSALAIQTLKDLHNFDRSARIEVTSRLVC